MKGQKQFEIPLCNILEITNYRDGEPIHGCQGDRDGGGGIEGIVGLFVLMEQFSVLTAVVVT